LESIIRSRSKVSDSKDYRDTLVTLKNWLMNMDNAIRSLTYFSSFQNALTEMSSSQPAIRPSHPFGFGVGGSGLGDVGLERQMLSLRNCPNSPFGRK
jgi:hypothetical protein